MSKTTVVAHSNIALVKYWGKRDESLILPNNSSVSVTLDELYTTTSVDSSAESDSLVLDGEPVDTASDVFSRVAGVLDIIRSKYDLSNFFSVESENNFPTAAGLASSASGIAALVYGAIKSVGLDDDYVNLSMLARRGSGSASRSLHGGFVKWHKGDRDDGKDSFAEQLAAQNHWPEFRVIVAHISSEKKPMSSRAGMRHTIETSPLYSSWPVEAEKDADEIQKAIQQKDIEHVGVIAERSAFRMHATMMGSDPFLLYFLPGTVSVISLVKRLRDIDSIPCFVTMDAGPQVKILTLDSYVDQVVAELSDDHYVKDVTISSVGGEVREISEN